MEMVTLEAMNKEEALMQMKAVWLCALCFLLSVLTPVTLATGLILLFTHESSLPLNMTRSYMNNK